MTHKEGSFQKYRCHHKDTEQSITVFKEFQIISADAIVGGRGWLRVRTAKKHYCIPAALASCPRCPATFPLGMVGVALLEVRFRCPVKKIDD